MKTNEEENKSAGEQHVLTLVFSMILELIKLVEPSDEDTSRSSVQRSKKKDSEQTSKGTGTSLPASQGQHKLDFYLLRAEAGAE